VLLAFGFPLYPDFGPAHGLPLTIGERGTPVFAPEILFQLTGCLFSALFFHSRFLQRRKHFGQLCKDRVRFDSHAYIVAADDASDKRNDLMAIL
jgi:hypothetical protein